MRLFLLIGVSLLSKASFDYAEFNGKIKSTNVKSISELPDNIQNDKVTYNKVKYANLETFDSRVINALTKVMNKSK